MNILSVLTEYEEKKIGVTISCKGREFKVYVKTMNGVVQGDAKRGLSTSYLVYFNTPLSIRQQHFNKIKKYVESSHNI